MFSILITQFYDNLSTVGPRDPPHLQLFSNKWGGNFEFESCKNKEDKFNESMPCITHSVSSM